MKKLRKINYKQTDGNDISIVEKVLNSENYQALELLKGTQFDYNSAFDVTYNNIRDEKFKEKAVETLNIAFPFFDTEYDIARSDTERLIWQQINSPFCKIKKFYAKAVMYRMRDQGRLYRTPFYNNWRADFIENGLIEEDFS